MKKRQKIYAYVDESGQDTEGLIFVVSILIFEEEKEVLEAELERIEKESGKKNLKWHKSGRNERMRYIGGLIDAKIMQEKIFYDVFGDSKKYIEMTSYATAKAILKKVDDDYKATVFVDGLKRGEFAVFVKGLRDLRIKTKKIRGIKKDENNIFIRLVDAICGLVRDAKDGEKWATEILEKMNKENIVSEL